MLNHFSRLSAGVSVLLVAVQVAVAVSPNSNVSFRASRNSDAGPSGGPGAVAVDLNGDGKSDVVKLYGASTTALGGATVLLGNGDGTFQPPVEYPTGIAPQSIQIADFNGDGIPDIAVLNLGTSTMSIAVLVGNGDGTFQNPVITNLNLPSLGAQSTMVAGDFDGNGRADVAVIIPQPQVNTSAIAVLLGNGDGTFQAPKNYDSGVFDRELAIGDFNGDGKLDLATKRNDGSNSIAVLLGNGDDTFQAAIVTPGIPSSCGSCVFLLADFNQDGKLDSRRWLVPVDWKWGWNFSAAGVLE